MSKTKVVNICKDGIWNRRLVLEAKYARQILSPCTMKSSVRIENCRANLGVSASRILVRGHHQGILELNEISSSGVAIRSEKTVNRFSTVESW